MPNVVLVPLNGTAAAELVLPHAEQLAGAEGRLVLVRAVLAHSGGPASLPETRRWVVKQAESYLHSVAARLTAPGRAVDLVVQYGAPAPAILDQIRISRPDLVAMTTYGRTERSRWCYGKVAEAVLRHCAVPVLLLPIAPGQWLTPALAPVRSRLLLPLDGSPGAEATLPIAGQLADQLGAELTLLQAVAPPALPLADGPTLAPRPNDVELDRRMARAESYLQDIQRQLAAEHPGVATQLDVRAGAPVDAIIAASREHAIDLILLATRGRSTEELAPLGGVANTVLQRTAVPLVLVRRFGPDVDEQRPWHPAQQRGPADGKPEVGRAR